MTGTTVLIAGAGPAGLTLACGLARHGIPFRLVEAAAGPRPGSRGKGVQPRTLEVFEDLGIAERVLAHGRLAMPLRATWPDGRVAVGGAEPRELRGRPDIPYPTSLITPQWRVEEALRLRLAELGGRVEFGTTLTDFTQTAEGVTATLVRAGATSVAHAHWLVGCDGGHSVVRRAAGITFQGETFEDVRMIVADVTADGLDRAAWQLWWHEEGLVSLCPLPSTREYAYQAALAPGADPELSLANLQSILDRRGGRGVRLRGASWTSLWRANERLADRYRQGRVFLAGDAAHVHSPAGGQGMNTGIQDAHNLAWKLAAGATSALLDTYETERRPVAAGVLALSAARMNGLLNHRSVPLRRDASTTQLNTEYRNSPLSHDDRNDTSPLRAGDRAPDATGLVTTAGEHRLFDLLHGGHFTLLSFGTAPPPGPGVPPSGFEAAPVTPLGLRTLHVVAEPGAPGELADTRGELRAAYCATPHTLALIRPDGHLGLISDTGDPTAVSDYLSALHC